MKTRQLGNLTVSEIGMGCMGLSHGYGDIPDPAYSVAAIRAAFDFGCTFFDTAEVYGPNLAPEFPGGPGTGRTTGRIVYMEVFP